MFARLLLACCLNFDAIVVTKYGYHLCLIILTYHKLLLLLLLGCNIKHFLEVMKELHGKYLSMNWGIEIIVQPRTNLYDFLASNITKILDATYTYDPYMCTLHLYAEGS